MHVICPLSPPFPVSLQLFETHLRQTLDNCTDENNVTFTLSLILSSFVFRFVTVVRGGGDLGTEAVSAFTVIVRLQGYFNRTDLLMLMLVITPVFSYSPTMSQFML